MNKIGIKDIAARAGVSIATVSHAFRNPGRVSKQTRQKVLQVAEELGYTPNNLAVSLRTARSGNIVVIIPDVAGSHNYGIIRSIENVAHGRGYSVLLGDTQGSEQREREFGAMTLSRQADGIILMSHRLPFNLDDDNLQLSTLPPLVNGCEFTGHDDVPLVAIDDVQAAKDATRHLIEYGHSNIAVITGDMNSPSSQYRLQGFRQMMQEAGLSIADRQIIYGHYTLEGGETAARELLLHKYRPTAIFCFSDEIALGCMSVLRTGGFQVPDDISVIGFDNIRFSRYFAPPLTTIAQPTEEIGTLCATLLLDLIDRKAPQKVRNILPHQLLVRESTRRLN
jgi:LacI family repressor for deo operon, udp, cdd, tsx, nupC, and nupG